ncbi:MAG TPA: glycoside hydrolase family 15 protein [Hyphomicrobiaceae bacterium]|jgi:GH15 family glucan-1,4-alpha-glucosidase|nr:glycoside hydrolase family 15 protein [Hyphomicrobiaceae bacterium]
MTRRIEDYALIGDCETGALVSRDGSIDWLCWPRFDSGAMFAALLGTPDNGRWSLTAADAKARRTRRYRGNTLILETEIETADGAAVVIDFMPVRSRGVSHVVRLVCGKQGTVAMETELVIRFDYGSIVPWLTRHEETTLVAVAGPDMVVLRSPVRLKPDHLKHCARFTVAAGQTIPFTLSYGLSYRDPPKPIDAIEELNSVDEFWTGWSSKYDQGGPYKDAVLRSLITLKALTYQQTGGIVAAVTTSLPEAVGGARNWDYRFCWLRDATFTLLSLMNSGYYGEAAKWRSWLQRAVAGDPAQVQIMYGLAGERRLTEWEVSWLAGYEGSRPVRIGNAAATQLQLDIYGEVMDALYFGRLGALSENQSAWDLQLKLLERLETLWREPDEGIWEVRGPRRHFTHSKVMAWVAFDRAIKSVERFKLDGPLERWRKIRAEIHAQVCEDGFDSDVGAFVQSYGATELDASALTIPLVGFLPPSDPRVKSTVAAIERHLIRDGLVLRYHTESTIDGLDPGEGAFLACSFWLVDNLVMLGRHDDAQRLFERLLGLRNDVGLLSEEYDAIAGRMVGNFPQAFSHVSLVNSAHNLSRRHKPAEQRSESGGEAGVGA